MPSITHVDEADAADSLPDEFEPYVKEWFWNQFDELTPPQQYTFDLIHEGENTLISAPTGSGKTLSAFLSCLNELFLRGDKNELEDQIYVLYVSPLRALNNDIHRNLEEPLNGIRETAEDMGVDMPEVRSAVRTGDTPDSERSKMLETPPHILITTPETLGILLDSPKFKEHLKNVKYVIADEIHSLCDNKRGVHLSLSLERLYRMIGEDEEPVKIGLSATQSPIENIARYLVGYNEQGETRGCTIVDVAGAKDMDLKVLTPVDDLIHTDPGTVHTQMYEQLNDLIQSHETTLIFTNTRAATERVVNTLKNKYPDFYTDNIGAHHSSMGRETRIETEERLKQGEIDCVVCSTSLEMGIDIGSIDLVIQLGSPKSIARGVQRVGRSGHKLHATAKGRFVVTDRDDAMECAQLVKSAYANKIDRVDMPRNCLDVLAQHIVGMACNRKWGVDEAFNTIRRSELYKDLERADYEKILDYLAGEHVDLEDQHVYAKIWRGDDRDNPGTEVFGRKGKMTRVIYMTNIGTIPDEANYEVYLRGNKNFIGTLDEEFLDRLTKGDIFVLGGSTYQFSYARGMKVYVDAVPEKKPTVPAWFSEMLPLSYDLGIAIGTFRKKIMEQIKMGFAKEDVISWIHDEYPVDKNTATTLYSYIYEQYAFTDTVPTHDTILVEQTRDSDGKKHVVFHTIYGRRVNDALSRITAEVFSKILATNVGITIDDAGFSLQLPPHPFDFDEVMNRLQDVEAEQVLRDAVRRTELMKRRFRHVAARALMILRNYKGNRKSVGKQQMQGHFLLHACEEIDPNFPLIEETYREIMDDAMDLPHAETVLTKLNSGEWSYEYIETDVPSPFAHSLILQGKSDAVLMEDRKERLQNLHQRIMERIPSHTDS